jgi:hypothetical protein
MVEATPESREEAQEAVSKRRDQQSKAETPGEAIAMLGKDQ